ncbi:PTS sugar transporter subunit IIA [Enterococcus camelliae]|uniref:PTS sugar transporter subunit IIA n=1 Tax=Enterococcus camelliae TaxID=453959 RepID=A0ABW5TJP8_9ENTE
MLVNKNLVFTNSDLISKEQILEFLAKKAFEENLINDISSYVKAVEDREKIFSTAVGYHVSIPHGKSESVMKPFIAFLRTSQKIHWDNNDNRDDLVDLIFLIGVPEEKSQKLHLKILASISKKILNESFKEKLTNASTDEAFELLREIELNVERGIDQ